MYVTLNKPQKTRKRHIWKRVNVIELTHRDYKQNSKCRMLYVVHAAPNSFLVEFIYFKWLFVGQTTQFYLGQHFVVAGLMFFLFFSGFPFIRKFKFFVVIIQIRDIQLHCTHNFYIFFQRVCESLVFVVMRKTAKKLSWIKKSAI